MASHASPDSVAVWLAVNLVHPNIQAWPHSFGPYHPRFSTRKGDWPVLSLRRTIGSSISPNSEVAVSFPMFFLKKIWAFITSFVALLQGASFFSFFLSIGTCVTVNGEHSLRWSRLVFD